MNTIKKYAGILWILVGPLGIYFLVQTALSEIAKKPHVDTKIQWIVFIAIFTPIYLGVVLPGPWFMRHRDNAQIKAFVAGATAAAAGAIAGAVIVLSRQTVTDLPAVVIAVASLVLLLKARVKEPVLVGLGAVAGLLLHWPF